MSDTENTEPTIQQLRDRAARASELEKSEAAKDRQIAFLKAGIDPDDSRMSYFVNGYQGELTKEAIVAEGTKAGFIVEASPEPPAEEAPPAEGRTAPTADQQEMEAINDSVRQDTAPVGSPPEEDPMAVGFREFHNDIKDGRRRPDAASQVIGRIIGEAASGNAAFLVGPKD